MGRRKLLFIAGAAAGALALLLVASAVSGTSPQQLVSEVAGGIHPSSNGTRPVACCGAGYPCIEGQPTRLPSYCCWCSCYWGPSQRNGTSPEVIPCALEAGASYCGYCPPPPCAGVCPMSPPPSATP